MEPEYRVSLHALHSCVMPQVTQPEDSGTVFGTWQTQRGAKSSNVPGALERDDLDAFSRAPHGENNVVFLIQLRYINVD